jgi:pyrophosphate--fructose-6-phosphate 1-phosphotransferase
VFVPEVHIDIAAEARRLRAVMDEIGCVNIFLSEGAGVVEVVEELEASGHEVPRDPFGHVQLDKVNPGAWFAKQFAKQLGAEKHMVQKSGYFSRSAAANDEDLALIKQCTDLAVESAMRGESGVIGQDEDADDTLRAIEFPRIRGGKEFDPSVGWFVELRASLGMSDG